MEIFIPSISRSFSVFFPSLLWCSCITKVCVVNLYVLMVCFLHGHLTVETNLYTYEWCVACTGKWFDSRLTHLLCQSANQIGTNDLTRQNINSNWRKMFNLECEKWQFALTSIGSVEWGREGKRPKKIVIPICWLNRYTLQYFDVSIFRAFKTFALCYPNNCSVLLLLLIKCKKNNCWALPFGSPTTIGKKRTNTHTHT